MKVIVDGDSCPFKEDIIEIASSFSVEVIIVLSVSHYYQEENEKVNLVVVDNVKEEADIKIFNITSSGDLVITGDMGLASMILAREAFVVSVRGKEFHKDNIDYLLAKRHRDARLRTWREKNRRT